MSDIIVTSDYYYIDIWPPLLLVVPLTREGKKLVPKIDDTLAQETHTSLR